MDGIAELCYDCDGGNGIGAKFSEVRDKTSYLACFHVVASLGNLPLQRIVL